MDLAELVALLLLFNHTFYIAHKGLQYSEMPGDLNCSKV